MSFAAYPLVVAAGDAPARRAGRVYIALVVLGEVLVLSGLLLLAGDAGGTTAGVMLWLGFGIKAGLVPLHVSLPLAYGVAPTAAAVALAGAMVNAGLLGWLRFLPLGDPAGARLGLAKIAFGQAGAFYGVLVGVTQRSPRVLLGYSSVSQMGLAAVGVGAGLVVPAAWPALLAAVLFHAVQHGFAKAALFAGLGVVEAGRSRLAWILLLVPALALAGVPFTSGALAKAALKEGLPAMPGAWPAILGIGLPLAAVGTTLLMARLLVLTRPAAGEEAPADGRWLGYGALLLAVLTVGWWLPGAFGLALPPFYSGGLAAAWPAALGVALAVTALAAHRAGALRLRIDIPSGDVLVPVERLAGVLWRRIQPSPEPHHHAATPEPAAARSGRVTVMLRRGEALLARWELAVLLVLVLVLLVLAVVLGRGT
jgi:formate hydrogenlyase subunit 3/multisubunit Na+/H+ antiporter MnhD subunit